MSFSFGDFPIKDKIVVVTGGGAGIGLAFVQIALEQGAKVLIADLKLHADAAKAGITPTTPRVVFQACDVTKWEQLANLITVSEREFGDVPDLYVANAGVFESESSNFWADPEQDSSYQIMEINVNHPIKLVRLAIRACLGRKKRGVILITASMAGYAGQYAAPLYSSSKHAIVGFTRSMADTGKYQGVKVVTVCPGIVSTPLWSDHLAVKERFSIVDEISISAEKVAAAMVKLVEDGKYASGTVYEISMIGERVIPEWNISPPGMVDGKMGTGGGVPQEAIDKSIAPILAITEKEMGRG